jgi:membrane protein required for colicin V production
MAIIDMFILGLAAWGVFKGLRKGFVFMLLSLIGFIAGFWIASRFSVFLIPLLENYLRWNPHELQWLAYIILFVAVMILSRLVSYLLEKFMKATGLNWLNRLAGGFLNAVKYLFIAGLILTGADEIQKKFSIFPPAIFDNSTIYTPLVENTRKIIHAAGNWKKETFQQTEKPDEKNGTN